MASTGAKIAVVVGLGAVAGTGIALALAQRASSPSVSLAVDSLPFGFVVFTATPKNLVSPIRYVWEFGDGSPPQTTPEPVVTWDHGASGTYTAIVTAEDSAGNIVSGHATFYVNAGF